MGTSERRIEIMRILQRRRHETISNLAEEFGVSTRTILRDIEVLSVKEPIYTQCGRYGGGVYVIDEYARNRTYMTEEEISLLHKLSVFAERKDVCDLSSKEKDLLMSIIYQYTRAKKER